VVEVHGVLCWGRQAADFFAEPPKIDVNAFWIHCVGFGITYFWFPDWWL
jgi:hypothetical protein